MSKDTSIIPKGDYCYTINRIEYCRIFTNTCPYYDFTVVNDVLIPTCKYLELMGSPGCTDEDFQKLLDYYGNHANICKAMPLTLLWDRCKECGENVDEQAI